MIRDSGVALITIHTKCTLRFVKKYPISKIFKTIQQKKSKLVRFMYQVSFETFLQMSMTMENLSIVNFDYLVFLSTRGHP